LEQDTFAFRSGEFPFAATRLVENGRAPGPEPAAGSPLGIGLGLAAAGAVVAGVVAVVVPHDEVTLYAAERPTFVAGALVIAALAGALSAGLARAA